jgi:hypothetical protein
MGDKRMTYPWTGEDWQRGTDLEGDQRKVWEEKVALALYGENWRVRADVERKQRKENPEPPDGEE